jgi:undecaprenyl-diphosphatase
LNEGVAISIIESVILGFVQGVTEFLPISSSGHLVILQNLFGMREPQVLFDVVVHVGTLAAILIVFREDVRELTRAALAVAIRGQPRDRSREGMLVALAVGCIPTAFIGMVFSGQFERMFASMTAAGIGLLITGLVLKSTLWEGGLVTGGNADSTDRIPLLTAVLIGTVQGFAIAPGVSRSGITISAALLLGVERELAARFSFLLAMPAILGALVFELKGHSFGNALVSGVAEAAVMVSGMLVAAITGIIALRVLLRVVRTGRLSMFAYYCWAAGLLAIVLGVLEN